MSATFVIDVETGASSANLSKLTAEFRAGKISAEQYAAAVEVASASISKFEAANSLAKMSLTQVGHNLDLASAKLRDYKSATYQAYQSLVLFHKEGAKFKTAFAGKEAVQLYNAELKKSISLNGQLIALGNQHYKEILKENAALQVQNAIKKKAMESDLILARGSAIQASSLSSADKTQMMLAMGAASAFKAAKVEIDKTAGAIDKASGSTRSGSQAFTAYGSAIRGVAGSMGALWMSYGQVLPLMAAFGGAQAIKQVYSLGSQFEYTAEYVATLGKYAGQSVRSVGDLREELLEVTDTRHNINELASGIREFSKAGVDVTTSLKDIGEMSRFASIAEMELVDATKLVIGQANAFGESYSDAANMISAAAMSSATDIGEMATAMSYTTELGSVAKVEFSEVAAAMGVLANNGIRGSKAGTALRTSILRMQNPTEEVTKMLERMNIQWSAFTEDGKVKSIQGMFTELSRAMKEAALTEAEMSELQYELFGLRSLKGGANLLKDITTGFVDMHEAVTRSTEGVTFLQSATADLADTAVVKWDKVKVAFTNALTGAFENGEALGSFLDGLKSLAESDSLSRWLTGVAEGVVNLGVAIQGVLSPLAALIALGDQVGEYVFEKTSLDGGETSWLAKMGSDFWENINVMKKYEASVASIIELQKALTPPEIVIPALTPSPGLATFSQSMSDPLANNPLMQQMSNIDAALSEFYTRLDVAADSNKVKEAIARAEEYSQALESISQKVETYSHKGADNLFEKMQKDMSAANIQFDKLEASFKKKLREGDLGQDQYEDLIAKIGEARAAASGFFSDDYDSSSLKAISDAAEKFEKFSLSSERVGLSDFEKGISKIRESSSNTLLELNKLYDKVLDPSLTGDAKTAAIEEINKKLKVSEETVRAYYEAEEKAFRADTVKEYADKVSDLAQEYADLTRGQRAVLAVNEKFDDAIDAVNKKFGEGSVEAKDFAAKLEQTRAVALTTDSAILKTSDSIRNGLVASLREAAKEMMTFGELGSSIGETLIGGFKQSISDMIVDLDFDKDALGDLWEGVWQSVSRTGADFVADRLVGTASSFLSDMLGVDLSGLTGAPTGASGSPFHVIVDNFEAGLAGAFGGENDKWWEGGAEAKTGIMGWISETFGATVADWVGKIGGAVGLAGGAYGMYAGAKDMSDGNFGAGALKMGTGAVSAYKGAVTLGIIEEGTATKIGTAVGNKVASYLGVGKDAVTYGKTAMQSLSQSYNTAMNSVANTASQTSSAVAAANTPYTTGGSMMHVGGSVAEGGALKGGSAASGASGGLTAAGATVGAIYAAAAFIAMKWATHEDYSQAQRQRDMLNQAGTTPGMLNTAGVTDQIKSFSDTLNRDMVPALSRAEVGSYNAGSQILVLGRTVKQWVETGIDNQGQLVDAMLYDTWKWDELRQAWVTMDSPINNIVSQIRALKPATDEAAASIAQMLTTQAGYPELADEVLAAYKSQNAELAQVGDSVTRMNELYGRHQVSLLGVREGLSDLNSIVVATSPAVGTLSERVTLFGGRLRESANATAQAVSGMNAQSIATSSLASTSVRAASDIGGAVGRIGGLLGRAASFSDPHYQGNADGAVYSYYARGGIMDQPTVFHVGGEAGSEAILPLHRGPQTLEFIDRKIDALLKNSGTSDELRAVLVAVATYTKKSADILKRFEYIGIPISKREAVA